MQPLTRSWLVLIALSLISTVLALAVGHAQGWPLKVGGLAILLLALAKARIILGSYLELNHAPRWKRGFDFVLWLFGLGFAGLYLAG